MNPRPFIHLLPLSIRERIFYRLLNSRQASYRDLFQNAPLHFGRPYAMRHLVCGDVISGQIAVNGFYELALSKEVQSLAREGGRFLDVGANLGYFTLLWLAGKPSNSVVAVEAAPRNQQAIRDNLAHNGVTDRCLLLACAAGDSNRAVTFDLGPEEQTGWGGMNSGHEGTKQVEVDMVRLDEAVSGDFAVMKVDVEGADTLVLKGCEQLLREKRIGKIFFEQHAGRMARLGVKQGEAQAFLESCGYRCARFGKGDDEWVAEPG